VVLYKYIAGTWRSGGTVATSATGYAVFSYAPTASRTVAVLFRGDVKYAASRSANFRITVLQSIVTEAARHRGKPYRWGGSRPAEGFDCSGLVAHVFDDALGMKLPRTSLQMSTRGTRIERTRLSAGDLVFFNTSRYAYSHVGIYIGRGRFVHAPSSGSLVRVERMTNSYWSSRFNGARRLVDGS